MIKCIKLSAVDVFSLKKKVWGGEFSSWQANVGEISISAWNLTLVYMVNSNLSSLQPDVAAYVDEKCLINLPTFA